MGITDSSYDLFEEESRIFLTYLIILDVIIELSSLSQFHDHEDIIAGVKNFIELYNIVMIYELKDTYLSFDLSTNQNTLDIMCLLFILRLFIILTATGTPVRSCRASNFTYVYISLSQNLLSLQFCPKYSARYVLPPSPIIINQPLHLTHSLSLFCLLAVLT